MVSLGTSLESFVELGTMNFVVLILTWKNLGPWLVTSRQKGVRFRTS